MKLLLVAALLVVAINAAPSPRADYDKVNESVQQLRLLVRGTMDNVSNAARDDNMTIGNRIAMQLEAEAAKAAQILHQAQLKIDGENLSLAEAQGYMDQLKNMLLDTVEIIRPDVEQLQVLTQGTIRDHFDNAYVTAESIAQDIYANLD